MKTDRIASHLNISKRKAALTLAILRGQLDPLKYPAHFQHTQKWVNSCHHHPEPKDVKLSALNELLEMHGVEAIREEGAWDNYYGDCVAEYLNTGDTYAPTIVFDNRAGKYLLTSYGDFVENQMNSTKQD